LSNIVLFRVVGSLGVASALLLAACGATTVTPIPTDSLASTSVPASRPVETSDLAVASAGLFASSTPETDTTGFAFAAEDVAAYYLTQGYVCSAPKPSTKAAGFTFRTCEKIDAAGRRHVIGLVSDPDGGLANGFASVKGTDTEPILAPIDALDPLSGFLGAMLGENRGTALLAWLASHLGDSYADTTSGPIKVATYTESADDHSTLYVELANRAYLDAPTVK